jgi:hypothetical protein
MTETARYCPTSLHPRSTSPANDQNRYFFFSQPERRFAAFHALDRIAHMRKVDRAFAGDLAQRLVARLAVIAPHDQLGIAVHYQVGVVAREYDLAVPRRPGVARRTKWS